MNFRAAALVAGIVCVAASPSAFADSAPEIRVGLERDVVGVGEEIHFQMKASSSEEMPEVGELAHSKELQLTTRPTLSSSQSFNFINGHQSVALTAQVDWYLSATRPGVYTVGPPSVSVHGRTYQGPKVSVSVVAAGKAPPPPPRQQRRDPFGGSMQPFDPWKDLLGLPNARREPDPPPDPTLAIEAAPAPGYFLHAVLDKKDAVVGEQIVESIYEYLDESFGSPEVDSGDVHFPTAADFLNRTVGEGDNARHYALVGGRKWRVNLVRQWAYFPLKTGDLTITPMTLRITRHQRLRGAARNSEGFVVHVTEPPQAGRPPGYNVGDVGDYALAAEVSPRQVEQGGVVEVRVTVSGVGNVPATLRPPTRPGAEWLDPEVKEQVGATGGRIAGKRDFTYVVRLTEAGDFALGELALPFWNPTTAHYEVARADLGTVHVKANASIAVNAAATEQRRVLPNLPQPREIHLQPSPDASHVTDSPNFWGLFVLGPPALFGLVFGGAKGVSATRRRLGERRTSPATRLRERLRATEQALRGTDARVVDSEITRTVEETALVKLGVTLRGALLSEVAPRLLSARVREETAQAVAALLSEIEASRFTPDPPSMDAVRKRWERARNLLSDLGAAS